MLSLKNISSGNFKEGQLYFKKLPSCGIAANLKNSFIYNFILIIAFNYKMLMGYFTKKVEEVIFYTRRKNRYSSVYYYYPEDPSRVSERIHSPFGSLLVPTTSRLIPFTSSTMPLASMVSPASACPA